MIEHNKRILLRTARQLVRQHFHVENDEQADAIAEAANRGHVQWGTYLGPTRDEFEARLLSVRALFERALVGGR